MLVKELLADKNKSTLLDEKDRQKLAFLSTDYMPSHYETSPKRYDRFIDFIIIIIFRHRSHLFIGNRADQKNLNHGK